MVVSGMAAHGDALASGGLERIGVELAFEELVGQTLIYEDLAAALGTLEQDAGVVGLPGGAIGAEIAAERLLAPRHRHRIGDRRERRYRGGGAPGGAGEHQGAT